METRNEHDRQKQNSTLGTEQKPKRFRIVRLEERIAPRTGGDTGDEAASWPFAVPPTPDPIVDPEARRWQRCSSRIRG